MLRFELTTARGAQPLYMQLANALEEHIASEQLAPGTRLPSEPALAAENNLSRATIMKAFELLTDRGLVIRKQGKGTFVRPRPMERDLPELSSFSEHIETLGLAPGSTLLDYAEFAASTSQRPNSPFPEESGLVLVERIRSVGGAPVGLQRLVIPEGIAAAVGLDEQEAAREDYSFYAALRAAGIALVRGEETLRAVNAEPAEAEHLGVEPGTALIEVDRTSYDAAGTLVEHVRARYLGTHYLYRVSLTNPSNGGRHETNSSTAHRTGGGYAPRRNGLLGGRD
ncbi:GntR family transcriptional regulator [Leucobacter allii]|uniref:GntR family transcriptional regulator n=1 Tax=Leucobacter allii TaxID=2932247 RepID=UPI001FD173D7|nr:GntR family transcriptional regulator [Leucobacter allii]UOR00311.1 GntR family transcriptional regulator [Leucobacter allii]